MKIQVNCYHEPSETVLEGDDRFYFACGHEEHILLLVTYTYIHLRAFGPF